MDILRLIPSGDGSAALWALTGTAGELVRIATDNSTPQFSVLAPPEVGAPKASCAVEGVLFDLPAYYWGTQGGAVRRTRNPDGSFSGVQRVLGVGGPVLCLGESGQGTCLGIPGGKGTAIEEISPQGAVSPATIITRKQATIRLDGASAGDFQGFTVRAFRVLGKQGPNCAGPRGVGDHCNLLFNVLWGHPAAFHYEGPAGLGRTEEPARALHAPAGSTERVGEEVFTATPPGENQAEEFADHEPWLPPPQPAPTEGRVGILAATDLLDHSPAGQVIWYWTGSEWRTAGTVPFHALSFLQIDQDRFAVGGQWPEGTSHDEPAFRIFAFPGAPL